MPVLNRRWMAGGVPVPLGLFTTAEFPLVPGYRASKLTSSKSSTSTWRAWSQEGCSTAAGTGWDTGFTTGESPK
jgi:hypothetical protein